MLISETFCAQDPAMQASGQTIASQSWTRRPPNMDDGCNADASALLDTETFAGVVAGAPLVAIDLIVQDEQGAVLLGLRNNPPAKGFWFVPGGRIRKNERLADAFSRITLDELGQQVPKVQSRFVDVYQHFYDTNFIGTEGATTHYVVLAYRLKIERGSLQLPTRQHSQYIWMQPDLLLERSDVHPYTQAYFAS